MTSETTDITGEGRFVVDDQRDLGDVDVQVKGTLPDAESAVNIQISTDGAITSVTLGSDETVELIDQLENLVYGQAELLE